MPTVLQMVQQFSNLNRQLRAKLANAPKRKPKDDEEPSKPLEKKSKKAKATKKTKSTKRSSPIVSPTALPPMVSDTPKSRDYFAATFGARTDAALYDAHAGAIAVRDIAREDADDDAHRSLSDDVREKLSDATSRGADSALRIAQFDRDAAKAAALAKVAPTAIGGGLVT